MKSIFDPIEPPAPSLTGLSLDELMRKGGTCPCCGQYVKMYRYSIAGVAAACLIRLYGSPEGAFVPVNSIARGHGVGGHWARLRRWGLIEEAINEDTKKRTSGLWRITARGREFVDNKILVPKYVLIYNGTVFGFEGGMVSIRGCLGNKFNYEELMETGG